jgi:sensor histidine kinase YesM
MESTRPTGYKSIRWIADDQNRLALHFMFWMFLYIDELLAVFGYTELPGVNMYTIVFFLFIDMCTVYFNLYVLVPAYMLTNKLWFFIAFSVISILINIELQFLLRFELACVDCHLFQGASVFNQLISDFASTTFVLGTAIGANILRRYAKSQMEVRKLQTDKLESELSFLKTQINPHLLFNSLNNIYVQTRKRPEEAAESVLLLSDLLRYQLYDCAKAQVKLNDEIEYLRNYLQLDKIRKNNTRVSFDVKGNPEHISIAPFLFIPFVENAVTHGIHAQLESFIDILFEITESEINFVIANSKPERPNKKLNGGIGLKNVKRRLELLYPEKHELNISNKQNAYEVKLKILLEKIAEPVIGF